MEIKKALTFRASSIGDCLMGKYLLENIHAQFPSARLGIVVASRAHMICDLFAAYPWLEIIEANRYRPPALLSLWKRFRGADLVVTQYAGKPGGRFGLASKLAARALAKRGGLVGFTDASPVTSLIYDHLVPVRPDWSVADHDRAALRAAGIPIAFPFPALRYAGNTGVLAKFGLEGGTFIMVHLFAGNARRGLHPDKKRELLAALTQQLPHTRLVVSGSANERGEALRITEHIPAIIIAGKANLQETMNLIQHSRAVVSVDTGIAHIAAQLGKPLVVMRTCLGRAWWLPGQYGNDAPITVFDCDRVCEHGHINKEYPACLGAIDMQDVAEMVSTL